MLELVLNFTCSSPNWVCDAYETIWKVATTLSFCWSIYHCLIKPKSLFFLLWHVPLFPLRAVFSVRSILSLISPFPFCLELVCTLQWNVPTSPLVLCVYCSSQSNLFNNICVLSLLFQPSSPVYCYSDSSLLPPFYLHITLSWTLWLLCLYSPYYFEFKFFILWFL